MKNQLHIALLVTCLVGASIVLNPAIAQKKPKPSTVRAASEKAPLAWLGPLPRKVSDEVLYKRMGAVMDKIKHDLSSEPDMLKFVCKTPAEVGPVPMLEVVDRFIEELPESQSDATILRQLDTAASKGNWLARAQWYALVSASSDPKAQYRALQLMEWLQERRIGALYALFGDALAGSGYYSDAPDTHVTGIDIFAAMHNSYPAQYKVGQELKKHDDPHLAAVGQKMVACANNALPAYARRFSGAIDKERAERQQQEEEASWSPLHRAVRDGDIALVEKLVGSAGVDINAKTLREQTPLDFALLSDQQSAPIVKLLILHGAEVANHGAVDKRAGPHDKEELLDLAVRARPANLDIIGMLVKAGAEPFQTNEINEFAFSTPAGYSFDLYESGENPAVLELFLSTKKLQPQSDLAVEFLEHSAGYPKAMERLIAYGISPERSDRLLSELVSESSRGMDSARTKQFLDATARLAQNYPGFARSLKDSRGYKAMSQAVYNCHFEFANWLLDAGAPMTIPDGPGELIANVVENCDKYQRYGQDSDLKRQIDDSRKSFLERLHARSYDFNVNTRNCPGWLTRGSICGAPEDDKLATLFLQLGADPYLAYSDREDSAVGSVIRSCRVEVLNLMLATPPRKLDSHTQTALNTALEYTTREQSSDDCPSDFMSNAARKLVSYGARAEEAR